MMPQVKSWADDLRAAFGAALIDAELRKSGYFASEGGRTIDTRKPLGASVIAASDMVLGPAPVVASGKRHAR